MPPLSLPLLLLVLSAQLSLLAALPAQLPDPDPLAQPSLLFPSTSPPSTIPAFPEQSDVSSSSSACHLDLSAGLLRPVSAACGSHRLPSRARCCPALAAALYSAYAATALSLPAALPAGPVDLPVLPDDSESCAGGVEAALKGRGVELPRVNATCDAAYCYCGVRLRRLSCPASAVAAGGGRWEPPAEAARRMERDCQRAGLAGCTRCLRALNQLEMSWGGNSTASDNRGECQLMGVTWLLAKNRTLYLPAATSVLRALMAAGDAPAGPAACAIPDDEMPFAVGSDEIGGPYGGDGSSAVRSLSGSLITLPLIPAVLSFLF